MPCFVELHLNTTCVSGRTRTDHSVIVYRTVFISLNSQRYSVYFHDNRNAILLMFSDTIHLVWQLCTLYKLFSIYHRSWDPAMRTKRIVLIHRVSSIESTRVSSRRCFVTLHEEYSAPYVAPGLRSKPGCST